MPRDAGIDVGRAERITRLGRRYVDDGRLPGVHLVVTRRGVTVIDDVYGMADVAGGRKLTDDTIYRIYSMTKPIASVALMQLFEEGAFLLEEPVSRYLPELAGMEVQVAEDGADSAKVAPEREVNITDVLSHQSGYQMVAPGQPPGPPLRDLAAVVDRVAALPLKFSPGTAWNYGVSTDIVARLVEVLSGVAFDQYLAEHIFDPLGMSDTGFYVPPDKARRLAAVYERAADGLVEAATDIGRRDYLNPPTYFSGQGGLVSTASDYQCFCEALLHGGERDGVRLLGRKTLELMTMNHLPDGRDLDTHAVATVSESARYGVGFGLGFSVVIDVAKCGVTSSVGQFGWGGAASTYFWVDPVEQVTALLMTQLLPSSTYPIRRQLQVAVYQALTD
jgi:CubicO group peptidase (beta-lactamase class C family)